MIQSGKANMIIDGQFGSTGKGLMAAYIAENYHIDIVVGRLSPNAGHTFYYNDIKYITKLIPVTAIIQPRSTIYMSAGCVIDVDLFLHEIKKFDIDEDRIILHPRIAVIENNDKLAENNILTNIGSTLSGSGSARSSKILRTNPLAENTPALKRFIQKSFNLKEYLDLDLNILVETGQGFDLGINSGLSYPYCTSVDVIPSAVLADLCLHPKYMGSCITTVRTYPIRVANPTDKNGKIIGTSGPTYDDSIELSWDDLKLEKEYTTVTNKVRRIFTFSKMQYKRMIEFLEPDYIFLNFINYMREEDLYLFKNNPDLRKPTHIGYGPYTCQINMWDDDILENYFYK